jgi:hypothetical protein
MPVQIPPEPPGLFISLGCSTDPLPPDRFLEQDAFVWFRAIADKRAYQDGIEIARKEAGGAGKMTEMLAKKLGLDA